MHALLMRLTLRQDVAEELMQELVVRLQRSGVFNTASDPTAYAARTAINLAMQWRREMGCRKPPAGIPGEFAVDCPSPLAGMERAEQIERVMDAVSRLRGACRETIVLYYVEQQSYEQVGRQLGKTEHQVRALCAKAMKRLRKLLDHERP